MFNVSGSELVFLVLIAFVVFGPEQLPEMLRKFGTAYGQFKKMRAGFESELRGALDGPMREMRDTADAMRQAANLDFIFATPGQSPTDAHPEPATDKPAVALRAFAHETSSVTGDVRHPTLEAVAAFSPVTPAGWLPLPATLITSVPAGWRCIDVETVTARDGTDAVTDGTTVGLSASNVSGDGSGDVDSSTVAAEVPVDATRKSQCGFV